MKKTISILGSTGSVGLTSLKICEKKKNFLSINLLAANKNYKLICKQIIKYNPKIFIIKDLRIFKKIKKKFSKKKIIILNNFRDISLKNKTDITISAIPGLAGLEPTVLMISRSKKILIANKEAIICGWNILKEISQKKRTKIIPIDSEHFSIFKLIENQDLRKINKIYLTASGGPFLNYNVNQFKKISVKDALNHPKWKMGKKITIDSSTLMNKILELIEAQKLFNIPKEKLDILIHPESLVHAIVEFSNGLKKFIYHDTTMIIPIANAIFEENFNYDDFFQNKKNKKDLIKNLSFSRVDRKTFPIIDIKNRANEFPSTAIILNTANELLVEHFLQKKIGFLSISKIILTIMNDRNYKKYAIKSPKNIKQILKVDLWAKEKTLELINKTK